MAGRRSPPATTDPRVLRERLADLLQARKGRPLDGAELEALAECSFRLALCPDATLAEAVEHLLRAVRLDGANPKHAFHLARLYFAHGQFDRAGSWLQRARRLAPTSHRIWAHIGLLQREINIALRGVERYEPDALRARSDQVFEAIGSGTDAVDPSLADFEPPESRALQEARARQRGGPLLGQTAPAVQADPPAPPEGSGRPVPRRITDGGRCRWSGIHDLIVEELLEAAPSERNRDRVLDAWARVDAASASRPAASAGFTILAVQWLVSGYPVSTIRRLASDGPVRAGAAAAVLEEVCALFEAPADTLPARLARAIDEDRLPPLLVAIIHRRRLLTHPLEFRTLGHVSSAARRFLTRAGRTQPTDEGGRQARTAEALEHQRAVERAAKELVPPAPMVIEDATPGAGEAAPASAPERIDRLAREARETRARVDEAWARLKALVGAARDRALDEAGQSEVARIRDLIGSLPSFCEQGLAELGAIRQSGEVDSRDVLASLDAVEEALRDLARQPGRFRKNLDRLPVTPVDAPVPAVGPGETGPAAERAAPPGSAAEPGLPALAETLARVDRETDQLFARALATFDAYDEAARHVEPLRSLRGSVRARQAEILYRLGRRREARRIWVGLLREDRLHAGLLRNLSVCDTVESEPGQARASWRAYAELLYFEALAAGTPRVEASARADFHQHFGGAYAPECLLARDPGEQAPPVDQAAVVEFLNRPARVRAFVDHVLIEHLNRRLTFTSPTLTLGVARAEGERVRRKALERLHAFADAATGPLPPRVRDRFQALVHGHLDRAATACASADRLVRARDPHYDAEKDQLIEIIKRTVLLKVGIQQAIQKNESLAKEIESLACLDDLSRLDDLPIDTSPELLGPVLRFFRNVPTLFLVRTFDVLCVNRALAAAEAGRCAEALPALLKAVDRDDQQPVLVRQALQVFVKSGGETRSHDQHAVMAGTVQRWQERARTRLELGEPVVSGADHSLTREAIDGVGRELEQALLGYFIAAAGGMKEETADWGAIVKAMTALLEHYAVEDAHLHRMNARWRLVHAAVEAGRRDQVRGLLVDLLPDARRVKDRASDTDHKKYAADILAQAERLLEQLGDVR